MKLRGRPLDGHIWTLNRSFLQALELLFRGARTGDDAHVVRKLFFDSPPRLDAAGQQLVPGSAPSDADEDEGLALIESGPCRRLRRRCILHNIARIAYCTLNVTDSGEGLLEPM